MDLANISLDLRNKTPLANQLEAQLRDLITHNALSSGERLPAVRELAEILQVNFNTVARAYRALDTQGLIITRQGRGTFIQVQPSSRKNEEIHTTGQLHPGDAVSTLLARLCDAADQAGISIATLQQMLGRNWAVQHPRLEISPHPPKRITRKHRYITPTWDPDKRRPPIKKVNRRRRYI